MAEAHSEDKHGHGHSKVSKPLDTSDVIIGTVLFVVFAVLLKLLLDAVVPGLLKTETLWQILISGLIFLGVWGLIGNTLFVPYLSLLSEREDRTVGYEKAAQEKLRDSKIVADQIEAALRSARLRGIKERDALVGEAKARTAKIVEQAKAAADAEIATARTQIEQLKTKARNELGQEADALAGLVVTRALESAPRPLVH